MIDICPALQHTHHVMWSLLCLCRCSPMKWTPKSILDIVHSPSLPGGYNPVLKTHLSQVIHRIAVILVDISGNVQYTVCE